MLRNIFEKDTVDEVIGRINKLTPESEPLWGTMSVGKMLAHCCVTYEMVYTDKHPKPNGIMKFILKLLVKKGVVSDKPYPKNGKTAPQFLIKEEKDFEFEKNRLIGYIIKSKDRGTEFFEGLESPSFGPMTWKEWNNLFYKHLDHHLSQFGV